MTDNWMTSGKNSNPLFSATKNYMKLIVFFLLGILFVISVVVMLLAYFNQKPTATHRADLSAPQPTTSTSNALSALLADNRLQVIKEYNNMDKMLEVKVDNTIWRKIAVKERKKYIMELSDARRAAGMTADVRITDYRSGIELAVSERGRIALAGHDD